MTIDKDIKDVKQNHKSKEDFFQYLASKGAYKYTASFNEIFEEIDQLGSETHHVFQIKPKKYIEEEM